jgi:L-ascorbate metabolism protein UlaG (beta-lactamase superfamily)
MKLIGEWYHPDVMCVGIDSAKPIGSREMTPREAAMAVSWVRPRAVIPTHYYEGSAALPEFIRHMESFAPDTVIKPEIDKPFSFTPAVIC